MLSFLSSFFSYLVLLVVIVAVAGIAAVIGITMRKKKNAVPEAEAKAESNE